MLSPSVSRGRAAVRCPVCPESEDREAVATAGGADDERGSYAILEAFSCERGHSIDDLTIAQEREVLASAQEWLADGREALRDAYFDAKIDAYRDGEL